MAGLGKGLKKSERDKRERQAEEFITGATERANKLEVSPENKPRERVYKRFTFSLTQDVSDDIDRLSLVPRDFRSSRSDVVKAGIEVLKDLPEEELIKILTQVK